MKKATIIAPESRKAETIARLKSVGVLHPELSPAENPEITALLEERERIVQAVRLLPKKGAGVQKPASGGREDASGIAGDVVALGDRLEALEEEREAFGIEAERIEPWGEFDPGAIRELGDKGIEINLYEVPVELFLEIHGNPNVFQVNRTKTRVRFALVGRRGEGVPEYLAAVPVVPLPETGPDGIRDRIVSTEREIDSVRSEIETYAGYRPLLERAEKDLSERIELERVRNSFDSDERIVFLTGYVPEHLSGKLEAAAGENGWGLFIREPESGDPVPTLVRTSKPVRIIRPVFNFLGTVPGYAEYDISFFFLFFFTIFVAMIIGDAGYGLLLVSTVSLLLVRGKKKGEPSNPFFLLLLVLGTATTIWGAVTGTWFGSEALAELPPFRWLIVDPLYTFNEESSLFVRWICFILGTVQLSIAHVWNFSRQIRQKPRLRAFAQLGWLSMVLGLYFIVMNFVLDPKRFPIPVFAPWMVIAGFVAVIIFTNQQGNFIQGALTGLAGFLPTFLSGMSAFADIISYIRLFAVGLAGVEIAKSFNAMAQGFGHKWWGVLIGAVILLVGHSLNIVMTALSVVVHGVRLNMLEFSGHLGMEWTGIEYAPFAERKPEVTAEAVG